LPKYIIYFNQQWVGEHSEEWFHGRGPLARAVVAEMEAADVLVFAGGLVEEIEEAIGFDESGHEVGPITSTQEFVGGLTIIDVETEAEAKIWGSKVAKACGWPQEVREFK
jgi:hypothetical protein